MKRQLPVLQPSPLPALYARWMDQLLAGPLPREEDATCDNCAMLSEDGEHHSSSEVFFNPQTKCCSYIPALPNYLVGRILSDDDPDFAKGRATLLERLRAGVNVTPLGIGQPPSFELLYRESSATLFGRSRTLRCPHYMADEGGRCGVWKHRASICATWYCKHVRGETGMLFWKALHQLLSAVEKGLARWCLLELEIGADALRHLSPPMVSSRQPKAIDARALDGMADPFEMKKLWGNWHGRVEEFYQHCAHLVDALSWNEVRAIGGVEVNILVRLLLDAYGKLMSDEIPERLKTGAVRIVGLTKDGCRIISYSDYDPLDVPKRLVEVLGYFDGRPRTEALAAITAAEGIKLDETLVRKLTDFRILIPT
jgi:hypothetical protein